ncbi:Hypothetical predicted protein [Pelobates cultripes]|uniref:Uncharacterized protein n=1 Tax=Pelobates cultripes TaxID=61616 RepID=A0AAD1WCZ2_PELCU|nr:Hypothetical predicted protein [Pelobates cultripes]
MMLTFYADLFGDTLKWRKTLQPFTTLLRTHNIPYPWRSPQLLHIVKGDSAHSVRDLMEVAAFLETIGLPRDALTRNTATTHTWDPARVTPFIP